MRLCFALLFLLVFFITQVLCAFLCKKKRTRFAPMIAMGILIVFILLIVLPIMMGTPIGLLFLAIPPVLIFGLLGIGLARGIFGIVYLIRQKNRRKS